MVTVARNTPIPSKFGNIRGSRRAIFNRYELDRTNSLLDLAQEETDLVAVGNYTIAKCILWVRSG